MTDPKTELTEALAWVREDWSGERLHRGRLALELLYDQAPHRTLLREELRLRVRVARFAVVGRARRREALRRRAAGRDLGADGR